MSHATPAPDSATDTAAGAAAYTPFILTYLYDWFVLRLCNNYVWRCSTRDVLLPFFQRNVTSNHMDIGVGTGFYLEAAKLPPDTHLTIVDLNENCLVAARKRAPPSVSVTSYVHDVFEPLPTTARFDSISLMYVFHCMPGTPAQKAAVFGHLKHRLHPQGVLFGATVLGRGVKHNWPGRMLMAHYNRGGMFSNWQDGEDDFLDGLRKHFDQVEARTVGVVLVFEARRPRG